MAQDVEAVQLRSYRIWESEGRPIGRDVDHWLQAEAELASEGQKASKAKTKSAASRAPKTRARKAGATTKKKAKPS